MDRVTYLLALATHYQQSAVATATMMSSHLSSASEKELKDEVDMLLGKAKEYLDEIALITGHSSITTKMSTDQAKLMAESIHTLNFGEFYDDRIQMCCKEAGMLLVGDLMSKTKHELRQQLSLLGESDIKQMITVLRERGVDVIY